VKLIAALQAPRQVARANLKTLKTVENAPVFDGGTMHVSAIISWRSLRKFAGPRNAVKACYCKLTHLRYSFERGDFIKIGVSNR
jgi:hypothetical protein